MNDKDRCDLRAHARKKTLKAGTIVYQNDQCTMTYTILNLSEFGAKRKPADVTLLPETFRLLIAYGSSYYREAIRRTRDQIAVRFV